MGEKFTVCCPIITTSAASLYKQVPKRENKHTDGADYISGSDCFKFRFQENAPGRKHTGLEDLRERSTVEICKMPTFKNDFNATSILTTVKIPGSRYDYDVVLTGDSYGGIILNTLGLNRSQKIRPKQNPHLSEETKRKTVGIFQVPHHGSRENSTMALIKGEGSPLSCKKFYMQFDADVYLISHGSQYDHPHSEVITGILSAAVQKNKRCKIVVTATYFEESKIDDTDISEWRDYVDIFYFQQGTPYVTLDPNNKKLVSLDPTDEELLEGLQLCTIEEKVSLRIYFTSCHGIHQAALADMQY